MFEKTWRLISVIFVAVISLIVTGIFADFGWVDTIKGFICNITGAK